MNLILILLQADQPPTTPTHSQAGDEHADHCTDESTFPREIPDPFSIPSFSKYQADASPCADDEEGGKRGVAPPGFLPRVAPEDGEEAEDFDGEEGETEDLSGAG